MFHVERQEALACFAQYNIERQGKSDNKKKAEAGSRYQRNTRHIAAYCRILGTFEQICYDSVIGNTSEGATEMVAACPMSMRCLGFISVTAMILPPSVSNLCCADSPKYID